MTYILREVRQDDIEAIQALLTQAHKGITNLPYDTSSTHAQIEKSVISFAKRVKEIENEFYLFVVEDIIDRRVIGVSAIKSVTGRSDAPTFFFRKNSQAISSKTSSIHRTLEFIAPISYAHGPSEVCSLFLDEKMRGRGIGSLLSLGRFLYIANHPTRFTDHIIAELRGLIQPDGTSPFYNGIGRHFFGMPFLEVLKESHKNPHIVAELIPHTPIYLDLLPESARNSLGMPHEHTRGAMKILTRIGFSPTQEFDIFDGGPKYIGQTRQLAPCSESLLKKIGGIFKKNERDSNKNQNKTHAYVSTGPCLPFKAMRGEISYTQDSFDVIMIDEELSERLEVGIEDTLRVWQPRHNPRHC